MVLEAVSDYQHSGLALHLLNGSCTKRSLAVKCTGRLIKNQQLGFAQ